jgi:hypothetical protein
MTTLRALWILRRRQAVSMGAFVAFFAISLAAFAPGDPTPGNWLDHVLTFPNVVAAGTLLFHFGMLRQQLREQDRRIANLEGWKNELDRFDRQRLAATKL